MEIDNKKDLEEMIDKMVAKRTALSEKYIEVIAQSVEINTKIFSEIKKTTKEIQKISENISNGMVDKIDENNKMIEKIHDDVTTKEGYLPKISNKLNYFWVPMILTLAGIIFFIAKQFSQSA